MLRKSLSRIALVLCLVSVLTISACDSKETSRFDQAQQESISSGNKNTAVSKNAVKGAKLNDFFPPNSAESETVFTQEKDGSVQGKLKLQGKDVATLAIFDTTSNPSAKSGFKSASEKINGFPTIAKGSQGTSVLVGDRYQVSIRSVSSDFGEKERKEWLAKFKLDKLAQLK